jgi:hypothetical protein
MWSLGRVVHDKHTLSPRFIAMEVRFCILSDSTPMSNADVHDDALGFQA